MGGYTKFMFDNFVLDDEENKSSEEVADAQPEEWESIPQAEPEEDHIEEDTEVATPDVLTADAENNSELYEETEPEPEEPEIITFNEEEVAQKVQEAESQAYQKGFSEGKQTEEAASGQLLQKIEENLGLLISKQEEMRSAMTEEFRKMALSIVTELVPSLQNEQAEPLIKKFLEDNFKNFSQESKLSFYFNSAVIAQAQQILANLARKYDFEGKITLHKDDSLGKSDCRVEWENGGVERNSSGLQAEVKELLEADSSK